MEFIVYINMINEALSNNFSASQQMSSLSDRIKSKIQEYLNNNNTTEPKFLNLWPTQFMEMSLPGHENANSVIADIVLSTSTEPEAFGRKSAEASSMTKPIISSNHGGSREII